MNIQYISIKINQAALASWPSGATYLQRKASDVPASAYHSWSATHNHERLHFSQRFLQIVPVNIGNFFDLIDSIWSCLKERNDDLADWNAKQPEDVEGEVEEVAVVWAWGYKSLNRPQRSPQFIRYTQCTSWYTSYCRLIHIMIYLLQKIPKYYDASFVSGFKWMRLPTEPPHLNRFE